MRKSFSPDFMAKVSENAEEFQSGFYGKSCLGSDKG